LPFGSVNPSSPGIGPVQSTVPAPGTLTRFEPELDSEVEPELLGALGDGVLGAGVLGVVDPKLLSELPIGELPPVMDSAICCSMSSWVAILESSGRCGASVSPHAVKAIDTSPSEISTILGASWFASSTSSWPSSFPV